MARTLNNTDDVSFPPVFFAEEFGNLDDSKEYYFRNASGKVVRRARPVSGDLYATENVDRDREFRVHVFNGKTLGVYEKLPHDPNQPYCKNDNCDFKRIDMADDANRSALIGVRPMAKAAVDALGLVFGGADVIISKSKKIFVNEVNSAPSLNSLNVDRFYKEIMSYLSQEEQENEQEIEEEQG
jgi:D-alanine-D-alanine ligase-like ATP-grasp enzyme